MDDFKTWFEHQFLEWVNARKKRSSLREFADYLNIDQRMVASWINGRIKPGAKYVEPLAIKLGIEVYDVLGLERPDPLLWPIISNWERMPEATKRQLAEQAGEYNVEQKRDEPAAADKRLGKSK